MLSSGAITRHIEDVLIPTYSRRYDTMVKAIRRLLLPLGVKIMVDPEDLADTSETVGGFFLYIIFPQDGSLPLAEDIAKFALDQYSLRIAPGKLFQVSDENSDRHTSSAQYLYGARLCWAWHEEETLVEGIERLGEVLICLSGQNTPIQVS